MGKVPGNEGTIDFAGSNATTGSSGAELEDTGVDSDPSEIGISLETEVDGSVVALDFFFFHKSSGSERGVTSGAAPRARKEARLGSFGSFVEDFFEGMMNDG